MLRAESMAMRTAGTSALGWLIKVLRTVTPAALVLIALVLVLAVEGKGVASCWAILVQLLLRV